MHTQAKLLVTAFAVATLVGCGSETPQATAETNKAFSGGPMPTDWKAKMASSQSSKSSAGKPAGSP